MDANRCRIMNLSNLSTPCDVKNADNENETIPNDVKSKYTANLICSAIKDIMHCLGLKKMMSLSDTQRILTQKRKDFCKRLNKIFMEKEKSLVNLNKREKKCNLRETSIKTIFLATKQRTCSSRFSSCGEDSIVFHPYASNRQMDNGHFHQRPKLMKTVCKKKNTSEYKTCDGLPAKLIRSKLNHSKSKTIFNMTGLHLVNFSSYHNRKRNLKSTMRLYKIDNVDLDSAYSSTNKNNTSYYTNVQQKHFQQRNLKDVSTSNTNQILNAPKCDYAMPSSRENCNVIKHYITATSKYNSKDSSNKRFDTLCFNRDSSVLIHYASKSLHTLQKLSPFFSKYETTIRRFLKTILFSIFVAAWSPCIIAIGFSRLVTYPLRYHKKSTSSYNSPQSENAMYSSFLNKSKSLWLSYVSWMFRMCSHKKLNKRLFLSKSSSELQMNPENEYLENVEGMTKHDSQENDGCNQCIYHKFNKNIVTDGLNSNVKIHSNSNNGHINSHVNRVFANKESAAQNDNLLPIYKQCHPQILAEKERCKDVKCSHDNAFKHRSVQRGRLRSRPAVFKLMTKRSFSAARGGKKILNKICGLPMRSRSESSCVLSASQLRENKVNYNSQFEREAMSKCIQPRDIQDKLSTGDYIQTDSLLRNQNATHQQSLEKNWDDDFQMDLITQRLEDSKCKCAVFTSNDSVSLKPRNQTVHSKVDFKHNKLKTSIAMFRRGCATRKNNFKNNKLLKTAHTDHAMLIRNCACPKNLTIESGRTTVPFDNLTRTKSRMRKLKHLRKCEQRANGNRLFLDPNEKVNTEVNGVQIDLLKLKPNSPCRSASNSNRMFLESEHRFESGESLARNKLNMQKKSKSKYLTNGDHSDLGSGRQTAYNSDKIIQTLFRHRKRKNICEFLPNGLNMDSVHRVVHLGDSIVQESPRLLNLKLPYKCKNCQNHSFLQSLYKTTHCHDNAVQTKWYLPKPKILSKCVKALKKKSKNQTLRYSNKDIPKKSYKVVRNPHIKCVKCACAGTVGGPNHLHYKTKLLRCDQTECINLVPLKSENSSLCPAKDFVQMKSRMPKTDTQNECLKLGKLDSLVSINRYSCPGKHFVQGTSCIPKPVPKVKEHPYHIHNQNDCLKFGKRDSLVSINQYSCPGKRFVQGTLYIPKPVSKVKEHPCHVHNQNDCSKRGKLDSLLSVNQYACPGKHSVQKKSCMPKPLPKVTEHSCHIHKKRNKPACDHCRSKLHTQKIPKVIKIRSKNTGCQTKFKIDITYFKKLCKIPCCKKRQIKTEVRTSGKYGKIKYDHKCISSQRLPRKLSPFKLQSQCSRKYRNREIIYKRSNKPHRSIIKFRGPFGFLEEEFVVPKPTQKKHLDRGDHVEKIQNTKNKYKDKNHVKKIQNTKKKYKDKDHVEKIQNTKKKYKDKDHIEKIQNTKKKYKDKDHVEKIKNTKKKYKDKDPVEQIQNTKKKYKDKDHVEQIQNTKKKYKNKPLNKSKQAIIFCKCPYYSNRKKMKIDVPTTPGQKKLCDCVKRTRKTKKKLKHKSKNKSKPRKPLRKIIVNYFRTGYDYCKNELGCQSSESGSEYINCQKLMERPQNNCCFKIFERCPSFYKFCLAWQRFNKQLYVPLLLCAASLSWCPFFCCFYLGIYVSEWCCCC